MTAAELQINDWVMYDPNMFIEDEYEPNKSVYPVQIASGEDIDCAINDCYAPITLTAEILEKNGFYLHNFGINTEMYYYAFPKECGIPAERGFGIHEQNGVFFITDHCLMTIRYIHELQRALRCCGLCDLANNLKIK